MTVSLPVRLLLTPIRFYQRFISPGLPASCRYYPTCSSYAAQALVDHGALYGTWLAIRRVGRCHPWHAGGHDPVPPVREPSGGAASSVGGDLVADDATGHGRVADPAQITPDAQPAPANAPRTRSNAA